MGRPPEVLHGERAEFPEWRQSTSKGDLQQAWESGCARLEQATSRGAPKNLALNRLIVDPERGLGVLARTYLLRDCFKTELHRDGIKLDSHEEIFLTQSDYDSIFDRTLLTATSFDNHEPVRRRIERVLNDPNWRLSLCTGKGLIQGLNHWFHKRYERRFDVALMSPTTLFETRFFGRDAPYRYLKFIYNGQFSPGVNRSLFPRGCTDTDSDHRTAIEDVTSILERETNHGKPILAVASKGRGSFLTRVAGGILDWGETRGRSICYIPLAKRRGAIKLNDGGLGSIVEALYKFINGIPSLKSDSRSLAVEIPSFDECVRRIRLHLRNCPTILIFDGYEPSFGPFPTMLDFIRDEPLARLLRFLQHPMMSDDESLGRLEFFARTFLVVLGDTLPNFTSPTQYHSLLLHTKAHDISAAVNLCQQDGDRQRIFKAFAEHDAVTEDELTAFAFLCEVGSTSRFEDEKDAPPDAWLQKGIAAYLSSLKAWQHIYLKSLALSETGLRWSTSLQIMQVLSRHNTESPLALHKVPSGEEFRVFIDGLNRGMSNPMLVTYRNTRDADLTEPFDHPTETITSFNDAQSWISLEERKHTAKGNVIDFTSSIFKELIRQTISCDEERILRRALCELALQAYTIRLRDSRGNVDEQYAARSLVEAMFHGMLSLPPPSEIKSLKRHSQWARAIPTDPIDAFTFLYVVVFKELLCHGTLANFGRRTGQGNLELELLLFVSSPSPPSRGAAIAIEQPSTFAHAPAWYKRRIARFDSDSMLDLRIRHLIAICECAKRVMRLEVFETALDELTRTLDEDPKQPGKGHLRILKIAIDFQLHIVDVNQDVRVFRSLMRSTASHIASRIARKKAESNEIESLARSQLSKIRRTTRVYVMECLRDSRYVDPEEINQTVDEASNVVLANMSASRIPVEVVALLTRLAVVVAEIGHLQRSKGRASSAIGSYFSAVALFRFAKNIAVARVRYAPLATRSKISSRTVEDLVHTILSLKEMLRFLPNYDRNFERVFRDFHRTIRSTLDTFAWEQSKNVSELVVMQILESAYARTTAPRIDSDAHHTPVISVDRLGPLERSIAFLRGAEEKMQRISGRPGLRVMLCIERIECLISGLDSLNATHNFDAASSTIGSSEKAICFVQWIRNDLIQIENLVLALRDSTHGAERRSNFWKNALFEKIDRVERRLKSWILLESDDEWMTEKYKLSILLREIKQRAATS